MGHSRSWLHVLKSYNSTYYRYLRRIGKYDFALARDSLNENMFNMSKTIYEYESEFENEIDFHKSLMRQYKLVYNKVIQYQNIRNTVNCIHSSTDCSIKLYKRAREIVKLLTNKGD